MDKTELLKQSCELVTNEDAALFNNNCNVAIKKLKEMAAEIKDLREDGMLDYIEKNGSFEEGGIRYYSGYSKKTTIRDSEPLLEALLMAHNGDLSEVVKCFAKNWAKVGESAESVDRDTHFKTVEVEVLKEGKPSKKVIAVKAEYVK